MFINIKNNIKKECKCSNIELDYVARLKKERNDLVDKAQRLGDFLSSTKCFKITNPYQRELMHNQLTCMLEYNDILYKRIKYEEDIKKVQNENKPKEKQVFYNQQ